MTTEGRIALRLQNQQMQTTSLHSPAELIAHMGALQGQDYAGGLWSFGARLARCTAETVEKAIRDKKVARTWLLRGTLHFVAPQDICWILDLIAPRLIAGQKSRDRNLELDNTQYQHAFQAITKALQTHKILSRQDMLQALETAGISTSGQRGYHLLARAALEQYICFGPVQGKQQTFMLLQDLAPKPRRLARDEAVAELAKRYFISRGSAALQDFAWWSGLTTTAARQGLEDTKTHLLHETIQDKTYWFPEAPSLRRPTSTVHLLPGFDEYILGYANRDMVLEPAFKQAICPGGNGMFMPTIIVDGKVAGVWKRTLKRQRVDITLAPTLLPHIKQAADRYGAFVGLEAAIAL